MAPGIQKSVQQIPKQGRPTKTAAANTKVQEFLKKIQILPQLKIDGKQLVSSDFHTDAASRTKAILAWAKQNKINPQELAGLADLIRSELKNGKLVRSNDGYIDITSKKLQALLERVKLRRMPAHERASVNSVKLSEKSEAEEAKTPIAKTLNIGNTSEIDQTQVAQLQLKPSIEMRSSKDVALLALQIIRARAGALA